MQWQLSPSQCLCSGLNIRGVPGVPQLQTEGLQVSNVPAMDLHPRKEGGWIGLGSGDFMQLFSYVYYVVCRSQEGVGSGRQEGKWSREGAARAGDGDMLGASADEGEGEAT